MNLDRQNLAEYYEIDFPAGRIRFTHYPSGEACGRHAWEFSGRQKEWDDRLGEFLNRHAQTQAVVSLSGRLVDNVTSYPHLGHSFTVGDVLLLLNEDGMYEEREIIGFKSYTVDQGRYEHLPGAICQMNDGQEVFWSASETGWMISGKYHHARARSPLPEEFCLDPNPSQQSQKADNGRSI
jgi:hypothetical protein